MTSSPLRTITYVPNDHRYGAYKELSSVERKLVGSKLEQLAAIEKKYDQLQREQQRLLQDIETSEDAIRVGEVNHAILDLNKQSEKIQAELTEMMTSALHNCFNLTIAQIDKMDRDERIAIFKELTGCAKLEL